MEREELETLISKVAATTADAYIERQHICRFSIEAKKHDDDHEFIDNHREMINQLTQTLIKINDIKWGVAKALAIAVVLGLAGLFWAHGIQGK